jgi:hypothetical protein
LSSSISMVSTTRSDRERLRVMVIGVFSVPTEAGAFVVVARRV